LLMYKRDRDTHVIDYFVTYVTDQQTEMQHSHQAP
jgi:hypothetical protein